MKAKINILFLLFFLSLLTGCSIDDDTVNTPLYSGDKKAQVVLTLSVPAVSIPTSTRAITVSDEEKIEEFALWIFDENNEYLYKVSSTDKDTEGKDKVVIRGNKIYATLEESETPVTLVMIANTQVNEPTLHQRKEEALSNLKFSYSKSLDYIPMYGETENPFIVKGGATPGNISLHRTLARIEVNASNALPNFKLESATVVNVNTQGNIVKQSTISNSSMRVNIETEAEDNQWVFYIPEAAEVDSKNYRTRTSVILKGEYKDEGTKFYRLDFIKRSQNGTELIKYEHIKTIERNRRYVFHIENIAPGVGSSTFNEALSKENADNSILVEAGLMTIDDEAIRDITTDNQYYLGITSGNLEASVKPGSKGDYYTVNMGVITNNPEGWVIDELPDGVEVSTSRWDPVSSGEDQESMTSVWVYISTDKIDSDSEQKIYIYSGNIKKTITIKTKEQ